MLEVEYGRELKFKEAEKILEKETAQKFSRVLEKAGVYKNNIVGGKGFERFLNSVGIKRFEDEKSEL